MSGLALRGGGVVGLEEMQLSRYGTYLALRKAARLAMARDCFLDAALESDPIDGAIALGLPEFLGFGVLLEEEDVAFWDAGGGELGEAAVDQFLAEALAAIRLGDGEVMEVAAAAVVAA